MTGSLRSGMIRRIMAVIVVTGAALAQPASEPKPTLRAAEHVLLGELVGDWDVRVQVYPGPEQTPVETKGVAKRKALLGGLFIEEELEAAAPVAFTLRTTIGFNPDATESRRFELLRLSSHSPAMMSESGSFDRTTKLFTFRGQYASAGQIVRTRTVMQITSAESATIEVFTALDPIPNPEVKKDPAEPDPKVTPEFKAYSLEYTRKR